MTKHKRIWKPWLLTIYFWAYIATIYAQGQNSYIQYDIDDDLPAYAFIGNIVYDSDLEMRHSSDTLQLLSYVFLTEGVHLDYFTLDELSGNIKSRQPVDRDNICPGAAECAIRLDIAVQPSKYFEMLKVVIVIHDQNDNYPEFTSDSVSYEFSESASPGIPLVPIELAKDIDSPKYGVVKYRLKSNTDVFGLDVKNSSGTFEVHLKLNKALDREQTDHYKLLVLAKDGGSPSKTGTLTININVLDINDNNPKFESSTYEVNTPENLRPGTSIITIEATDQDIGENGEILYSFSPQTVEDIDGTFTIERATGMIYLENSLDYETRSSYSLIVVAQDQGQNSLPANTRVLINVIDVNDHVPAIIINTLSEDNIFRIEENKQPEVFVVHISILDEDHKNNGHVECFLSGDERKFQIVEIYDKEFKIVTTSMLDRELQAEYGLHIKCQDYGAPQLTTEATITVKVADLNDNTPEFSQENYHVVLQEHTPVGTSLIQVTAVDLDSGPNGKITYKLAESDSHLFDINPKTGEITVIHEFDREVIPQKVFHVIASDNGDDPRSSSATVIMDILDIDDQVPKFTVKRYHMNVSENMPVETRVGIVKAIDRDAPQNSAFTYYLEAGRSAIDSFEIDPTTGVISTKRKLDREDQSRYKLFVLVQSDTSPNRGDNAEVEVIVLDKNDNAPQFIFPSYTKNTTVVSNRLPTGHSITTITAVDVDSGSNKEIFYKILEGNEDGYFKLDHKSGELIVEKALSSLVNTRFYLKVVATDNGKPPQRDIGMLYLTINSTAPVILNPYEPDSQSVRVFSMSGDLLAVIVGCVCGAIVIVLAVVLAIVLFMRKRKQTSNNNVSWYTTHPSDTPSKDDLMAEDTPGNGNVELSHKFLPEFSPIIPQISDKTESLTPTANGDLHPKAPHVAHNMDKLSPLPNGDIHSSNHYVLPTTLVPSGNLSDEKDNDSGCADLSQGSNEDHVPAGTVLSHHHPAKHHQTHHLHLNHLHHHHTPDKIIPMKPRIDITKSTSASPLKGYNSVNSQTLSRPYIEPSHIHLQHQNPNLQQSFADWLHSEGEQLKSQGNKYRVSHHHLPRPISPRTLHIRNGSTKKTVRFTEPDGRRRRFPVFKSNLAHGDQGYFVGTSSDDYGYGEFGRKDVKPSTSDGNIYKSMYSEEEDNNTSYTRHNNYGSLDRRRKYISNENIDHPIIMYSNHNDGMCIDHDTNDGSLV